MALRSARGFLTLASFLCGTLGGCADDTDGKTEVLVAIDAVGQARDSSSVRIEVNAAVVELAALPGKRWPLEVLVTASDDQADKTFRVRAWGLTGTMVNGSGQKDGSFKKGKRSGLEVTLDPAVDVGAPPPVNAQIGPGKIVVQPDPMDTEMDAGDEPSLDAGADTGSGTSEPDGGDAATPGADDCDAGTCDGGASEEDACIPSPMDCGGCGIFCAATKQCIDGQCLPIPDPECEAPFQISGHAYQYCRDLRSWDSARIACRARGYDLVIFESLNEYSAVASKLSTLDAAAEYWLGGHDRGDNGSGIASCTKSTAEGIWHWVDPKTGSEQGVEFCRFANSSAQSCTPTNGAFSMWSTGQPDNDGCSCGLFNIGACNNAEDCLAMSTNGWNDTECSDARTYLCEDF